MFSFCCLRGGLCNLLVHLAPLLIGWTSVGVFAFYSQFMNHGGPLCNSATCQRSNSRCPYIFWLYILFWSHFWKKMQLLQFCSEFTYAHHWNEWDSFSYLFVMFLFQKAWKKKVVFFPPHVLSLHFRHAVKRGWMPACSGQFYTTTRKSWHFTYRNLD